MSLKIGITGRNGFLGYHLINTIKYTRPNWKLVDFNRAFFDSDQKMDEFTSNCDIIIHLAGINRDSDKAKIRSVNLDLAKKLIISITRTSFKGKLIFSSSTQEFKKTEYGKSKKIANELFYESSIKNGFTYHGVIIPNIFGPFCRPNYNSFISTFCYNIHKNSKPNILEDNSVKLIYVSNVVDYIIKLFNEKKSKIDILPHDIELTVSDTLNKLIEFNETYISNSNFPYFNSVFDINLFNTFRSYMDLNKHFPKPHHKNIDERGFFTEIVRTKTQGQFSYSLTNVGFTRGNHFHTRKIERFSVIEGSALIELRKIGDNKIYSFLLNGENPCFVDMPVWYTHNIKNISNNPLVTLFWINEPYNDEDPDTFYENV